MTVTLQSLFQTVTLETLENQQYSVLSTAKFPVSSWAPTSVPRVLVRADATAMLDLANLIPTIAAGGLLDTAEGDWLTLVANSEFQETRNAAVATRRDIRLTDASGSPTVINAGDLYIRSTSGLRYRNVTGGTLAALDTLTLSFEAEVAGLAYNATSSTWLFDATTTLPDVTLDEPTVNITQSGSDEEGDESLRAKCRAKWAVLGAGANNDAYVYWAKNTPDLTETISRVYVRDSYPLPGQVTIYVATDAGPASAGSVTIIQAYLDPATHLGKAPNCVDAIVAAASAYSLTPVGTLYVRDSSYTEGAEAEIPTIYNEYASELGIGAKIYKAEQIQRLMSIEGAVNAVLTTPSGDVTLNPNQVAVVASTAGITVEVVS